MLSHKISFKIYIYKIYDQNLLSWIVTNLCYTWLFVHSLEVIGALCRWLCTCPWCPPDLFDQHLHHLHLISGKEKKRSLYVKYLPESTSKELLNVLFPVANNLDIITAADGRRWVKTAASGRWVLVTDPPALCPWTVIPGHGNLTSWPDKGSEFWIMSIVLM